MNLTSIHPHDSKMSPNGRTISASLEARIRGMRDFSFIRVAEVVGAERVAKDTEALSWMLDEAEKAIILENRFEY